MKKKVLIIFSALLLSMILMFLKNSFSQYIPGSNHGMSELIRLNKIDNLFMGSSTIRLGIDPYEIGEDDFILAYNGNEPTNIYNELDYLIKNNVSIKTLYIDMYVWTSTKSPWIDDLTILWDTDLKHIINIYSDMNNASLKYAYEYFVSANNDYLFSYPISSSIINNYYYKGGANYASYSLGKDYLDSLDFPHKENSRLVDEQINAIKKIKKLCDDNNINLVYIETPKYIKEANWQTYLRLMNDYKNILEQLNIKYVLASEINIDNSDPDYFIDLIHLSSKGREKYTEELIKYISNN